MDGKYAKREAGIRSEDAVIMEETASKSDAGLGSRYSIKDFQPETSW